MNLVRKIEPSRKLNTKGCCFLCLQTENIDPNAELDGSNLKSIFIQNLLRHLQIPAAQSLDEKSIFEHRFKQNIQVDLCENCEKIINRFSVLFQKLEAIQLEMNYFLERIHKCISQSAKDPDQVQNYSKRMTSDLEALSQLAFVDNLRKEVSQKCLKGINVPRLQVILNRTNKLLKTENSYWSCGSNNDWNFPGNVDCTDEDYLPNSTDPLASPPPSPYPNEAHKEDLKLIKSSSAQNLTKNEKLSLSPKPPVKQNVKKGMYCTKHLSTGMYKCNKCDKKSKYPNSLGIHNKAVHLNQRYKCDICNISVFTQLDKLTRHKTTCQDTLEKKVAIEEERKNFQFVCDECGKRFKTKHKLDTHHFAVHKNVGRYPCDLCDKKFKKTDHLKTHRNVVHLGKRYNCELCTKSFSHKFSLRLHKKNCVLKLTLKGEPLEILQVVNVE